MSASEKLAKLLKSKGIDPSVLNSLSNNELENCLIGPNLDSNNNQNDLNQTDTGQNESISEPQGHQPTNDLAQVPANNRTNVPSQPQPQIFRPIIHSDIELDKFSLAYSNLNDFIDQKVETRLKFEISQILFPLFTYGYISLIETQGLDSQGNYGQLGQVTQEQASHFFNFFSTPLYPKYSEALNELSSITHKDHLEKSEFCRYFKNPKTCYVLKMHAEAHLKLGKFLQNNEKAKPIEDILMDGVKIKIENINERPRGAIPVGTLLTGMGKVDLSLGDSNASKQGTKLPPIYIGTLKYIDHDIRPEDIESEDENRENPDQTLPGPNMTKKAGKSDPTSFHKKPYLSKKKAKDVIAKYNKTDNTAPARDRIPIDLPNSSDTQNLIEMLKDAKKKTDIGRPEDGNGKQLPSILNYTLLNSTEEISANAINDNSTMYAHTIRDGNTVRIWTLTSSGLKRLKSHKELQDLSPQSENIFWEIMDENEKVVGNQLKGVDGASHRDLIGHTGRVFAISFSPCRHFIITSGEDSTIRLWSLLLWSCVVIYKCGPSRRYPVWSLDFAHFGRYFASGGADKLVRVWSTSEYYPIRIFYGHESDVNVVKFHQNTNYVASGSDDRTVRLWDLEDGSCVRIFNLFSMKQVLNLAFSPCGRYLASSDSSSDKIVVIWDVYHQVVFTRVAFDVLKTAAEEAQDTKTKSRSQSADSTKKIKSFISHLSFSRDVNEALAVTTTDGRVNIYNMQDINSDDINSDGSLSSEMTEEHDCKILNQNSERRLLCRVLSKSVPISLVHFTWRNLILTFGSVKSATLLGQ